MERGPFALAAAGRVDPRDLGLAVRGHHRSGVGSVELAELPLPRQEPQRIVQASLDPRHQIVIARAGLEPDPGRDRSHHVPPVKSVDAVWPARLIAK
jgi:hypothetical protein